MKIIKYKICKENPECGNIYFDVQIETDDNNFESNASIAKRESYNGEFSVIDDGQPETEIVETTDEVLNALLGVTV